MDWPAKLRLRPITTWPGQRTPDAARRVSPFSEQWATTMGQLDLELHQLRAKDIWLEIAIPGGDQKWRQDGRPRAHAKADHPGVVLVFYSLDVGKDLSYSADRFTTWQDNLRAIVLGLEALRKVERYGIANRGEQYAGFAQLPQSTDDPDPEKGRLITAERFGGSIRDALHELHPDKPTGNRREFEHVVAFRDQQRRRAA